jgi:hypothetical protein
VFNVGDRVTWHDTYGETRVGTVAEILSEQLIVDTDGSKFVQFVFTNDPTLQPFTYKEKAK